jgi:protease-4
MKRKTKLLLAGLFLFLGFVALVGAGLIYMIVRPPLPSVAVLELEIGGEVPESQPTDPFSLLFMEEQRTLLEYSILLDRAAEDDDISAVLVRISPLMIGWARTAELRGALQRFQGSGKPVFAHLETGSDRELYLASVADRVMCVPEAFMIVGLAAQPTYYGDLLEKIHVEAEFEQAGKYKSAAETLTRSSMSEEFEESLNALLDTIHAEYRGAIASARGLDATAVQDVLDRGLLRSETALEAGLFDELAYEDEILDRFEEVLGEEPEMVSANRYWRRSQQAYSSGRPKKIALIYGEGPIYTGSEQGGFMGVEGIWSRTFSEYVRDAREDDSIDAIVLRVNSPGGSGTASDIIWREIVLARSSGKPVVVSMGDVAASGGYYISMPADRILALPTTITGSIGVVAGKLNMGGLYDWAGINIETVKRGERADMFSSARGFTPEEREILKEDLEGFYETFVAKAAEGRGMDYESLHEVAQGRVWSGRDAAENGLVDELGGLWTALDATKGMLGVGPDENVALVVYPRRVGLLEALRGEQARAFESSVPEPLVKMARYRAVLERLSRERVLALLPVWFDWN